MKVEIEKSLLEDLVNQVPGSHLPVIRILSRPKIHVEARRWFQKTYGNTYHSVSIYVDDALAYRMPFGYGYGEQWLQTAIDWLSDNGYCELEYGTRYFREELGATYNVIDVNKKKDL